MVAELIRNRMKLDPAYNEKMFPSFPLSNCGVTDFYEVVIATYIDLETLIEGAGLTEKQRKVVDLLMLGWSMNDICEEWQDTPQNIQQMFKRAVAAICAEHDRKWNEFYGQEKVLRNDEQASPAVRPV